MKNILTQAAIDASQSPKAATVVAAVTTGSGVSTILDIIPADIGKIATLIGIALSIILICTHSFKFFLDYKEHKKRMKVLDKELEE